MMSFKQSLTRSLLLLPALLLGVGLLLSGCDTTSTGVEDEAEPTVESDALSDALVSFSKSAVLSEQQTQTLQALADKYKDVDRRPGQLWFLAADVHTELTSDQIQKLKTQFQERLESIRGDRLPPGRGHKPPLRMRGHLALKDLDLTDAQKDELRSIRAEYRDELKALREKCQSDSFDEADAERWRTLRSEMREAIREVLTEEQREQMEARREELTARRDSVREARREALGLTDEQVAQFEELRSDSPALGVRCDNSSHGPGPRGMWGNGAAASILTQEQREIVMIHHVLLHETVRGHRGHGPKR